MVTRMREAACDSRLCIHWKGTWQQFQEKGVSERRERKKWTWIPKIWIALSSRMRNNCMSSSCHGKHTVRSWRPPGPLPPLFPHRQRKLHHGAAHQHRSAGFSFPFNWQWFSTIMTTWKQQKCKSFLALCVHCQLPDKTTQSQTHTHFLAAIRSTPPHHPAPLACGMLCIFHIFALLRPDISCWVATGNC